MGISHEATKASGRVDRPSRLPKILHEAIKDQGKADRPARLPRWGQFVYRNGLLLLPAAAALLLSSVFVVLKDGLEEAMSPYGFLILVVHILFAPVEKHVGAQLESFALNLTAMIIGIGWSQLALGAAVLAQHADQSTTAPARVIKALFYALLCFLCGWAHAGSSRVARAAKLANFLGTWILLRPRADQEVLAHDTVPFVYVTLLALGSATACGLIVLPKTANAAFLNAAVAFLDETKALLTHSIELYLLPTSANDVVLHQEARSSLSDQLSSVFMTYWEAVLELGVARIPAREAKPLLGVARRLKSVFTAGLACEAHFDISVVDEKDHLGSELVEATRELGKAIGACFDQAANALRGKAPVAGRRNALHESRKRFSDSLEASIGAQVLHLRRFQQPLAKRELLRQAYFGCSLVEIAVLDAERCLDLSERLANAGFRWRICWPKVDRHLFWQTEVTAGVGELYTPQAPIDQPSSRPHFEDDNSINEQATLASQENESRWPSLNFATRRRIYRIQSAARHSTYLAYALKNVVGCMTLSVPAFLPLDAAGAQWWLHWRCQWIVISFLFVLSATTGDTLRISILRTIGTILGALYGLLTWVICHDHPTGLVIMMTVGAVPFALVLGSKWATVGVVWAVTIPPVAFAQYLDYQEGESVPFIALQRAVDVIIGIGAAILVTHLISPAYAHREYEQTVARALEDASRWYLELSRQNLKPEDVYTPIARERFEQLEGRMQRRILRLRTLVDAQDLEFSLLPKPLRMQKKVIDSLEVLTELFVALRFIRIHLPRRAVVLGLRDLRSDLVAAIHLNLFACAAAFRAQCRLPQMLPSPREALDRLTEAVHSHLQDENASPTTPFFPSDPSTPVPDLSGLATAFALAEGEVLSECVEACEQLLDITRLFYGTASFTEISREATVTFAEV